jgi:hypothetical protein
LLQILEQLPDFLRSFDILVDDAIRFWDDFQSTYLNNGGLIRFHFFTDDRNTQSFLAINRQDNSVENLQFSDSSSVPVFDTGTG